MTKISIRNLIKLKKEKLIAFSSLLVLLLAIGSSAAIAQDNSQVKRASDDPAFFQNHTNEISNQFESSLAGHRPGLVPEPINLSYLSSVSFLTETFPAYYDLRTLGKVTSVKDQGSAGSCWAFATYGSLESYLMPGENWDFSENNMKNLLSDSYPEGFDFIEGGNRLMSTAYLTRWNGPVLEADDPYDESSTYSPTGLPIQKHVQQVLFIPDRKNSLDNSAIKWALQNYGALRTSMNYDNAHYSSTTYSYYYSGTYTHNHAVTIVGWDDNYNRNNFLQVPPGNGAFIVKNSWGEDWGDNGYFYISYYDSVIGTQNAVFTAENKDSYDKIYQYDPLGWSDSLGYYSTTGWCANIFTAKSNELLKAVSFYTTDTNCNYEIYIYTDPTQGPISQTIPVYSKSGATNISGYHTIPLDSTVQLQTDQKFSVVLKLTTPELNYPIPMEEPLEGYSSKATANPGESFISADGNVWEDITIDYPNTNVCIKAFTDTSNLTPPVLPGYTMPPTDPNNDGLYEDLNGNGKIDFKDVQAFWHNMYWMENQNGLSAYFDFNHNGKVDYKDFQRLYKMASNS